jgi:hypothetical protein
VHTLACENRAYFLLVILTLNRGSLGFACIEILGPLGVFGLVVFVRSDLHGRIVTTEGTELHRFVDFENPTTMCLDEILVHDEGFDPSQPPRAGRTLMEHRIYGLSSYILTL